MLSLGLCHGYVLQAQKDGQTAADFVPVTMLITAVIYGVAACMTFLLLKKRAQPQDALRAAQKSTFATLLDSWQQARPHTDFKRLLLCAVYY